MNYIAVGEILKPQGIKGAVKVKPLTDDPKRFDKLKLVYIGGRQYRVAEVSYAGAFVVLSLLEVSDMNAAELLRGKLVEIDRVNAADPGEGGYLVADILNCDLADENGKKLGVIINVESFGAADVITAKLGQKEFRFPFLNRIIHKIDIEKKQFCVIKKLWEEVVVFDD